MRVSTISLVFTISFVISNKVFEISSSFDDDYFQREIVDLAEDQKRTTIINNKSCGLGRHSLDWMSKVNSFGCKFNEHWYDPWKRINSGYSAVLREFPSFVQVKRSQPGGKSSLCGGVLISQDLVLTAGHCLRQTKNGVRYVVYSGSIHVDRGTKRGAVIGCRPRSFRGDIASSGLILAPYDWAIIKLSKGFNYSSSIQPACVNMRGTLNSSVKCVVPGFGRTNEGPLHSERLKAGVMSQCRGESPFKVYGTLCFEASPDDRLRGKACKGDSGGPLYCYSNCDGTTRMVVVGLVSGGNSDNFNPKSGHLRSTCTIEKQEIFTDIGAHAKAIQRLIELLNGPASDLRAEKEFTCFDFRQGGFVGNSI